MAQLSSDILTGSMARQDFRTIVRLTRRMSEKERAVHARDAATLAKLLEKGGRYRTWEELDPRFEAQLARPLTPSERRREIPRGMGFVADVVCYALCGEKDLPPSADLDEIDAGVVRDVLVARRPPWLGSWLTKKLAAKVESQVISWPLVRGLVRAGVVKGPLPDGYYQLLASPWTRGSEDDESPADMLRADKQLLVADVWQLFERDTRAFRRDSYFDESWDWGAALVELASGRVIARGKLLDATLRALANKFQPTTQRGLLELHDALEPTAEERAARTELYAALAKHANPKVRALAVTPVVKGTKSTAKATGVPAVPSKWPPTWKPIKPADIAKQPVGTVLTYRTDPFLCFALKVSDNRWLEPNGIGDDDEAEALAQWKAWIQKPPRAPSYYLDDKTVKLRASLEPKTLKRAAL